VDKKGLETKQRKFTFAQQAVVDKDTTTGAKSNNHHFVWFLRTVDHVLSGETRGRKEMVSSGRPRDSSYEAPTPRGHFEAYIADSFLTVADPGTNTYRVAADYTMAGLAVKSLADAVLVCGLGVERINGQLGTVRERERPHLDE
jgi:hypothetical protein